MGTIVARKRKNGTTAYMAKIILKREGKVVYRESETFERKPAAVAWMANRETALAQPGAIERASRPTKTLADAIDAYTASNQAMGRTKEQVLRSLRATTLARKACEAITSADIVALAEDLVQTRKPQTVGNYLSHLQAVFAIAEDAWGIPLDMAQMVKAMKSARRLGTVTKGAARDRRPTLDELDRVLTHFQEIHARRPSTCPMHLVTIFALFSTRRQEEITRITWADYEGDRVLVRDMKHPGQKIGNNVWCVLPAEAQAVIAAMPRTDTRMFPYTADAISAAFTRACQFLGIEDLHFHDLRHEGISRLFEIGWDIPRVSQVSGHRSWASLQRYTHMRQVGDKYEGWAWLVKPVAASAG